MLMGFIWVLLICFGIGCVLGIFYGTFKAIPMLINTWKQSKIEDEKAIARADEKVKKFEQWFDNKFGKVDRRYH